MTCSNSCVTPTVGAAPALFSSALKFFAASQCLFQDNFKSDKIKDGNSFHFIVVGGGTAGSVVANLLSEIPEWNVLLLEAGPPPPIESYIPQLDRTLYGSKYDWNYTTINNGKIAQAFKTGNVPWTRGKMLGGSGSMNGMFYIKNYKDYEVWEQEGNPSWNRENVVKYFKKAESFQNLQLKRNPFVKSIYGDNGPQPLNRFNSTYRNVTEKVLESCDEIGFTRVTDLNAKFSGLGKSGITTVFGANGQRYSSYQSYLLPIRYRKNLKIVTNAFVVKILINNDLRAYGVQVDIGGKRLKIYADFEVIISAGVINTPQLLMLSGIGPKTHLESKNITCIVDLPGVGKNLQDHIFSIIPIFGDQPESLTKAEGAFETIKYLYNRTGLLAEIDVTDLLIFYGRNSNASTPEFQSHLVIINKNDTKALSLLIGLYKKSVTSSITEPIKNKALYIFGFNLLHPLSRGKILLNSSNPYDKPLIDSNYFDNPLDLKLTAIGMKMLSKIVNTPFFKSINAFLQRVKLPECDRYTLDSDQYWQCQSKNTASSVYHPVGTSKMGPNPIDCVVNNFLKVYNISSLRIIDASIMPNITSGNTNAPTIMIGEMGSDMIKTEYNNK